MGKLTCEQIESIKKLFKEGKGLSELGRMYNCDHTSVSYHLGRLKRKIPVVKRNKGVAELKAGFPKGANKIYRYNVKTLTNKSNSQYADYLSRELLRQKKTKKLRDTNGGIHNF